MIEALKTLNYNKKLIRMLLEAKAAAIAVNLVGPLFYLLIYYSTIPLYIIYPFIIAQFTIFFLRMLYGKKLLNSLEIKTVQEANSALKIYISFIFASSFLWGLSTSFVLLYGNESQTFTIMALIFIMIAGSLATLTPIFHAAFFFIINIIGILSISLVFLNTNAINYILGVLLLVFLIVVLPAAFTIHKAIRDSLIKNDEIRVLNLELKQRVQEAIAETKQKEKLLQEQMRLAQMGEMISMIAHQWRQPLGAISSALLSIKTKEQSGKYDLYITEQREEFLSFIDKKHSNINDYVQVLSHTIDDFRNFFKPDKDKELVRLTSPITRALQIVKNSLSSKNITLKEDYTNDEEIFMYQNEIMQVILNIIKNSEDNFLEKAHLNPEISIKTYKQNTQNIIEISDNGGGISQEILSHIFDPYFSTKDEKNGTGLGLYMSKTMIEEHNQGQLIAQNTRNGISFKIYL